MDVVKLGKKGQVSIPRKIVSVLGLRGDSMLLVEKRTALSCQSLRASIP